MDNQIIKNLYESKTALWIRRESELRDKYKLVSYFRIIVDVRGFQEVMKWDMKFMPVLYSDN